MRHYILFPLFLLGLIESIWRYVEFERKLKHEKDADYRSLFRERTQLGIVLFGYLAYEQGEAVYRLLFDG